MPDRSEQFEKDHEEHLRSLQCAQDDEDRLVSASMKEHARQARSNKSRRRNIKQHLVAMINKIVGYPED